MNDVSHATHDCASHETSNPTWTETWYWNAIDPATGRVAWAHLSWLPALGRGQHVVSIVTPDCVEQRCVETRHPFQSELLVVEVLEPWNRASLRCDVLDVDLTWRAFHDAIDFATLLHVGESLRLSHFEGGGRARGTIAGRSVDAPGFRDRSFGPRDIRTFGRHWCIGMIGRDSEVFLAVNVMSPRTAALADPPTIVLGALWRQSEKRVYDGGVIIERHRDASPALVRFPDGIEVALDLSDSLGETRFIMDPNSAPVTDPTKEPVYALRDFYLPARSAQLGSLVGWYEEGSLWVNA